MYLFFDTETTGLPRNYNAPASDLENWSRLVQLAFVVADENGNIFQKENFIIKPSGFEIPREASNIHGITTEIANEKGLILKDVMSSFYKIIKKCDCVVAHNISFDEKIVDAELIRCKFGEIVCTKERVCTMRSSTEFCQLPNMKWPKLQELHEKLFGCKFEEAHNALADVEATVKCFFELKKKGVKMKRI